ncbi:DUF4302 domain-containing protein [Parapedobacter tibetensis]|uniref:DUF4302 domain-containing protein n=1 Tax=Parapedobacter tibetensis TaxID=2972951 RepID=UPI00214DE3AA|nr:DUF4302 domain-containing protein [Parapedobacter tibetensis]
MRKFNYYTHLVFVAIMALSCSKMEDRLLIDGLRPEERIRQSLDSLSRTLTGSEHGWIALLKTNSGYCYSFHMAFGSDGRVGIVGDMNEEIASETFGSTYRIVQGNGPVLMFDTYNIITLLTDPTPDAFGGKAGSGYGSDIEFEWRAIIGDTLSFIGKKQQVPLTLVRATAAEREAFTDGQTLPNLLDKTIGITDMGGEFLSASINGIPTQVVPMPELRKFVFAYVENGTLVVRQSAFYHVPPHRVVFVEPMVVNGERITELVWDEANQRFVIAGLDIPIEVSEQRILPPEQSFLIGAGRLYLPNMERFGTFWSDPFVSALNNAKVQVEAIASAAGVPGFTVGEIAMSVDFGNKSILMVCQITNGTNSLITPTSYRLSYELEGNAIRITGVQAISGTYGSYFQPGMRPLFSFLMSHSFRLEALHPIPGFTFLNFVSTEDAAVFFAGVLL